MNDQDFHFLVLNNLRKLKFAMTGITENKKAIKQLAFLVSKQFSKEKNYFLKYTK